MRAGEERNKQTKNGELTKKTQRQIGKEETREKGRKGERKKEGREEEKKKGVSNCFFTPSQPRRLD